MNILEPSGGDGTARKERRLRGTTKKKEIRVPQTSSNCQRTRRKKHRLVYISSSARASSGALRFGIAVHFAPDVEDLLAFPRGKLGRAASGGGDSSESLSRTVQG
jgi:hypothetical protein